MNAAEQLLSEVCREWAPPPKERLSEWAEKHFRLSSEYSAKTGDLRLYNYQREPLDAFTDPYTREIVIMSATQMLKTLTLQCIVAYVMARDPGPVLLAQPTETDAETFSKERLAPMIRDMECLSSVVAPEKRTSSANTTLHKVFKGGALSLVGAQTAGNFARRSIRVFLADERDKWKKNVGKEGDAFALGVKRTATFRSRAKIVQVCSPTVEGESQIASAYEGSDQRKFWVPCHACGEHQVLKWAQVRWESSDPASTAYYECASCGAHWNDAQRWEACERGEWRASKPFAGVAGFWISELYSPWKKLADIAQDFLRKKDDPSELQTFINTSLAELWRQPGEEPMSWEVLKGRRESYLRGQAPDGVLLVTAGADVQKDRIIVDFWGWGRGKQRWFLDRQVLLGDTSREEVWKKLDAVRDARFIHSSGVEIPISLGAIDSGYSTAEVYAWSRGKADWIVIKGQDSGVALLGQPQAADVTRLGQKIRFGVRVWPVNVSMAKAEIYGQLRQEPPVCPSCVGDGCEGGCHPMSYPAGWVHFPADAEDEWFRELTAERFTYRLVKGFRKGEWVNQSGRRNEALDCANYARAAAAQRGLDRFGNSHWAQFEKQLRSAEEQIPAPAVAIQPKPPVAPQVVAEQPRSEQQNPIVSSNWMRNFFG